MKTPKFCVFSGTADGRAFVSFLKKYPAEISVCNATEYGEQLVDESGVTKYSHRMNTEQMTAFFTENAFDAVIDCTHPYAVEVTQNIIKASSECAVQYYRLLRKNSVYDNCVCIENMSQAVDYIKNTDGNVLLTTGAKELTLFKNCGYENRLYARVLPFDTSLLACKAAGIEDAKVIAMQGPFPYQMNKAILQMHNIKIMLTKDSGDVGGFEEKIAAAMDLGVKVIVIKRPDEKKGYALAELKREIIKKYNFKIKQKVYVVGLGIGAQNQMTIKASEAILKSDIVFGAKRVVESIKNKKVIAEYKAEKIADYLKNNPEISSASVVFSGDIGFYSGAKQLYETLTDVEVEPVSGLSSPMYLANKLFMPWQDIKLTSLHGRKNNILADIKSNKHVFALLGGDVNVKELCELLIKYGLGDVTLHIGERLSYKDEKITKGTPNQMLEKNFDVLACVIITNEKYNTALKIGVNDDDFIRAEKTPMTKAEVRAVVMSKLVLTKDAIVYDIGAGTGSVSIEMAQVCTNGVVYGIEKNDYACETIEKNKLKFAVDNINVINGKAPEALQNLPEPSHIFIGGSAGNLADIIAKYPKAHIVVTASTLETLAQLAQIAKERKNMELVQLAVTKAKPLAGYNFLTANNPITIATFPVI